MKIDGFETIHIFSYGEIQLIGEEVNGKVNTRLVKSLTSLVDHIKTFRPRNVEESDFHVIHIFNDLGVRYLGQGNLPSNETKKSYAVELDLLDLKLLLDVVEETKAVLEP